jgi:hypothetical protein
MADLSHFDCYSDFSLAEASYLAAGIDIYAVGENVRGEAVARAMLRGFRIALRELQNHDVLRRSDYSTEAFVPKGLDPDDVDWPAGVPITWSRNGERVSRAYDVRGDSVRFTRQEIARWLRENGAGMSPAYQFVRSTGESLKGPKLVQLGERERASLLRIIGALVEHATAPGQRWPNQAALIEELVASYGADKEGISKSGLEAKFAEAKRRLHD